MSDQLDYARLAAAALKGRAEEARPREVSRDHGIGVVAQAMAERKRRRTVRTALVGALVASAAGAALFVGLGARLGADRTAGGHVRVEGQAGKVSEHRLEHGQSVVSGQGRSTVVEFGSGTRITLREQGELVYREDTAVQRFGLVRGAAHLVVAKLESGQRFVVDTEDAEVEVRGTVFDVAVERGGADCPRKTLVSVTEGAVEVRARGRTLVLRPGQNWQSACAQSPAAPAPEARVPAAKKGAPPAAPLALAPADSAEKERAAAEAPRAADRDAPDSALTEQNDLYAEATAARRQGDRGRALRLFERLLERFPRGPLAESADVERIRILKHTQPERARVAAERHIERYRDGIASAELKALAEAP